MRNQPIGGSGNDGPLRSLTGSPQSDAGADRLRAPTPLTSFIGRDEIVAEMVAAVRRPDVRLLTLYGPGGVGKTRLALRVSHLVQDEFPDGVGFIPLGSVDDPARVLPSIAAALGVPESDGSSLLARVSANLAARHCLLVLDNFEQVVDAAPVLTQLLESCPLVAFLVTSRTVLRISGEHVYPVPPMSLDRAWDAQGEASPDHPCRDASEAVQLFVERAMAVSRDFTLDDANRQIVADICARLDGLPLAIELAASHSRLLPPPTMLELLDLRLPLLTRGPRDQPQRLQTMHNAIAWSFDLLDADEQALFRRLSTLVGSFSLAAAIAIGDAPESCIIANLSTLIDQSMVQFADGTIDEPRYAMLGTIREFGADQLAAGDDAVATRDRHAAFFLALAERNVPKIDGLDGREWLARLDLDRPNLRAALAWLSDQGRTEDALRLTTMLWRYWRTRGTLSEGYEKLSRALERAAHAPLALRADALWKLGYLHFYLGEFEPARSNLEQSIARFTEAGDRAGTATAHDALGIILRIQREFAASHAHHERSLRMWRELGDRLGEDRALGNLGMLALDRGELTEARECLQEALAIANELGSLRDIGERSVNLGRLNLAEGNLDEAEAYAQRGLEIFEQTANQIEITIALSVLSQIARAAGDVRHSGDILVRCLRIHLKLGLHRLMADVIEMLGTVIVSLDASLATRLLAAAEADREATGVVWWPTNMAIRDAAVATAQSALGSRRFVDLWQAGSEMSVIAAAREAVALAPNVLRTDGASVPDSGAPEHPGDLGLTPREVEVLELVAQGHTNSAIAEYLFLSPATVKRHISNILGKLESHSRAAAAARAHELGLLPVEP